MRPEEYKKATATHGPTVQNNTDLNGHYLFITLRSFQIHTFTPTEVICRRVKVLVWWGAGEGQAPAQTAIMHHHIEEDMRRHHLNHWVQRPNCQVRAVLQRLPRSDKNIPT